MGSRAASPKTKSIRPVRPKESREDIPAIYTQRERLQDAVIIAKKGVAARATYAYGPGTHARETGGRSKAKGRHHLRLKAARNGTREHCRSRRLRGMALLSTRYG